MATSVGDGETRVFEARSYQLEMLEQSLRRNIIVAMDTGSGKTNVAILRVAHELERCDPRKRVWFLCPKVALAQQQYKVIKSQLPSYPTKLLVGKDGCETWTNRNVWEKILLNIRIVVCTHQILYDALCHAGVSLSEIALVVFDEAHNCKANHPSNKIMKNFYQPARLNETSEVPCILGLTASPVFNEETMGLQTIEKNLDAICRTPRIHREELLKFVHRPELLLHVYQPPQDSESDALQALTSAFHGINISQDPWIKFLEESSKTTPDQLRKAYVDRKTDCQTQIMSLARLARTINDELGSWASAAYISDCIKGFLQDKADFALLDSSLLEAEALYLFDFFSSLKIDNAPELEDCGTSLVTPKVDLLIEIILTELELDPNFSCIVFVETRAGVCMLKHLLQNHPRIKDHLKIGVTVGSASSTEKKRKISDVVVKNQDEDIEEVLNDLRDGRKNLLISTTVVEEGIDITACNNVICFDEPKNLVSFIQRRGRARSSKSKYHIMMTKKQSDASTSKWAKLEEEMKLKYMDEMRELERLQALEHSSEGYREFEVPATGAKITLDDALQHLNHFCNTLPRSQYASTNPTFIRQADPAAESFSYKVLLPNSVHSSLRQFESSQMWESERLAKQDAAFEAYTALYRAELVNDYLLPNTSPTEEDEIYKLAEKRPNMVVALPPHNPWRTLARAWLNGDPLQEMMITISKGSDIEMQMRMLLPGQALELGSFSLHYDADTILTVELLGQGTSDARCDNISLAKEFTRILLGSIFRSRMSNTSGNFPLLYIPEHDLCQEWIDEISQSSNGSELLDRLPPFHDIGLLRDENGRPHYFDGIEKNAVVGNTIIGLSTGCRIKAFAASKKVDFLKPAADKAKKSTTAALLLDPKHCSFDHLPLYFSRFAQLVPSIMHMIRNALVVNELCASLLAPVGFTNKSIVLTAISAPVAQENDNYQRLEFLGDAMLKYYTSATLIANHPTYHEGYLAHLKDRIVSNKALSMACTEKGLDQFILRKAFESSKWRPLYNDELLEEGDAKQEHVLSTKVLADVVEALLGAAYLDGGETKLVACLDTILSKTKWVPLSHQHQNLISAIQPLHPPFPPSISHLEALTSHTFTHPALALEALTHPSHASTAPDPLSAIPSYQRLEFLGDAVLDHLVTRLIHSHSNPTYPVNKMHLFRTAAVSKDFLAYLALTNTTSIPTTEIHPTTTPFLPLSRLDTDPEKRALASLSPPPTPSSSPSSTELNFLSLMRRSTSLEISRALAATISRLQPLKASIAHALKEGDEYPWTALVSVAPDKMISDLIESTLGAIYVDSHGSEEACIGFVEKIGLLPWLRRALREGVKVWHPKEELGVVAARMWEGKYDDGVKKEKGGMRGEKVVYEVSVGRKRGGQGSEGDLEDGEIDDIVKTPDDNISEGNHRCRLLIGGRKIAVARGVTKFVAETKAADMAVRILRAEAAEPEISFVDTMEEMPESETIDVVGEDSPISSEVDSDIDIDVDKADDYDEIDIDIDNEDNDDDDDIEINIDNEDNDDDINIDNEEDELMEITQSEFESNKASGRGRQVSLDNIGIGSVNRKRKERSPDSPIDLSLVNMRSTREREEVDGEEYGWEEEEEMEGEDAAYSFATAREYWSSRGSLVGSPER